MQDYEEKIITIGEVEDLLNDYDIEVYSPDGYVPVNYFVDKGPYQEYILTTNNGYVVRCNAEHLFQTEAGWVYAKDLVDQPTIFLTQDGYSSGVVVMTDNIIPIVDINVDHENHRYYTNGVSSHNTGAGKSLFLCHFAASYLAQGKNVLYITLELAEEEIGKRIDANLLNVTFDTLQSMDKDEYDNAFGKLKSKTQGRLFIKEYPTASASVTNFNALLNELKLKKRFKPDVVIVDYLNICASARIKSGSDANSYTYIKSIAEELRGFAVEHGIVVWSATQTNRSGFGNSDAGLENTADSFGLPATADFMVLIYAGEELQELGQIMVKQLKSRYNDIAKLERFNVGVDKSKMKLFDVDDIGQYGSIVGAYQNRPAATPLKKFKNTP